MTFASKITFVSKKLNQNIFSFFNSFSASKCFVLFELIFRLRLSNLSSKSVFVTKFARANLTPKTSAVSLLNSEVVIYLS